MNRFLFGVLMLLAFIVKAEELKRGDLLFVVGGDSSFSTAITDATAMNDTIQFDHVAILNKDENDSFSVIEASPKEGVREIGLQEFLDDNRRIVVKRLKIDFPIERALEEAEKHIGEGYDWWYLPDNGKMYCSELIWECYRDNDGAPIFKSNPMNFRRSDGSMPQFWIDLFEEIGMEIPEGVEGTNPNDLSKDENLIEICRIMK